MKIELELPDWCDERNIYIMAGIELAAYRDANGAWHVKAGRCNLCGKCCMSFKNTKDSFPPAVNGRCIFLKQIGQEYRCKLGVMRPFKCSMAARPKDIDGCTERYEDYLL